MPLNLKILLWNIYGFYSKILGSKLCDQSFLEKVSKYDILCLVETHENKYSDLSIVGFHKLDSVKRDKVKFKSSGGMAVYVKDHIKKVVSPIKNIHDHTDTLWFKIKKDFTTNRRDIFVGNVYFSPEVYEKKYNKDYFSLLEKEIAHFRTKGEVLVQGDFNARTGDLQDLVEHSKFFEDDNDITSVNTNSNFKYRRNSEDYGPMYTSTVLKFRGHIGD